jgi:hypothetical protein
MKANILFIDSSVEHVVPSNVDLYHRQKCSSIANSKYWLFCVLFSNSLFGSHWSMGHPWNLPFHFSFLI